MLDLDTIDLLRQMISSHLRADRDGFVRAAELIIRGLVASNRHSEAKALQQSLRTGQLPTGMEALNRFKAGTDKLASITQPNVSIEQVVFSRFAKEAIDRIILEHRQKSKLLAAGLKPIQRLLFWGPPGCGKTLTSMMLASELSMPLVTLRLSAIITSYVGETSANLQRIFEKAKELPTVLLIDEVDALAKHRDDSNDVGELKRVVNTLLQLLDEFQAGQSILIGCSNHQYLLDSAVWRRFDEIVHFPLPTPAELLKFAQRYLSGVRVNGQLGSLTKKWSGFSYSDLEKVLTASVKAMVLNNWKELPVAVLLDETLRFQRSRRGTSHKQL